MINNEINYFDEHILPFFKAKNVCWEKLSNALKVNVYKNYCIVSNENPIIDDREVIYIGNFKNHWGHFITDEISKIYYLLKNENSNLPIVYCAKEDLKGNYLEFFELLGIDTKRLIRIEKPTQFKKVFIPEESYKFEKYYSEEYENIFNKIKENVEEDKTLPKKIFLSRKEFKKAQNRDFGEIREIEKFFEDNSYTIIYPEKLTLAEQIKYYKSCDEIVVSSGSVAHNLLFCKPNTKAIILNRSYVFNARQATINKIAKVNVINIDSQLSMSYQHVGIGPFYYHFSEQLIQFALDNNLKYTIPENNNYLKDYLPACKSLLKEMIKQKHKPLILNKKKPFFNIHLKKARGNFKDKFLINWFNTYRFFYFLMYLSK